MTIPVRHVSWAPCWRIIPAKFEEDRILRKLADEDEFEAVSELEQMTNERLRQEKGEAALVAARDVVTGPGHEYIMAPFTYPNPDGSRFSDGSYGVYYAARRRETAIEETKHHREIFMRRTNEPSMRLETRAIKADINGDLHDVRGMQRKLPDIYQASNYSASQALGRDLVKSGSFGIAYDSVRHKGGECLGIFRPRVLSHARAGEHMIFEWDGRAIAKVFELKETKARK